MTYTGATGTIKRKCAKIGAVAKTDDDGDDDGAGTGTGAGTGIEPLLSFLNLSLAATVPNFPKAFC